LTGGALAVALAMIVGLLVLIVYQGSSTFWPSPVVQVRTVDGQSYLGDVTRDETYRPDGDVLDALPPEARARARVSLEQSGGTARRRLLRTGNFELSGTHFTWVSDFQIDEETRPEWALVLERVEWGNFYGTPDAFLVDGLVVAAEPADVWARFQEHSGAVVERYHRRVDLERDGIGETSRKIEEARVAVRQAQLGYGPGAPQVQAAEKHFADVKEENEKADARINEEIRRLDTENARYVIRLRTAAGPTKTMPLAQIVRAYPANHLTALEKEAVYLSRWREFLSERPRESNTEGGVFPAIWGTVAMTLLMSLVVVPFGVLAALYLREYAKSGPVISAVRIAINNLAGVPSIVFGVFGLGFFCYLVGAYIDGGPKAIHVAAWPAPQWWLLVATAVGLGVVAYLAGWAGSRGRLREGRLGRALRAAGVVLWLLTVALAVLLIVRLPYFDGFFQARYSENIHTFGTGGLFWASLTLALLTVPVVIVSTEEALAAVPNSMREGSYACGASKWQTIRRIVLPRAMPGIMTGTILAMARGAGEVAPLMLVGAVKLAPELPVDGVFPYLHPSRSFMHLGFHIYDVGFQSPNSEAARPMVFTTALLLITIIAFLNVTAVWLRSRLRKRFATGQF